MSFIKNENHTNTDNQKAVKVFFDNRCEICRREIAHYQFLDGKYRVQWVDISDKDCDLSPYGINRLSAMRVFHVIDGDGQVHTGVDAFILLWSVLPGLSIISKLFRIKPFKSILAYLYGHFSRWRFKKQCQSGVCL